MKSKIHSDNIFAPLINKSLFQQVHIEGPSIAWNDYIDIAPETLYEEGVLVK